ncbi:MAG: HAD family hydrolase [Thermoplasmata archaeon]|nr:HAD family hydrolase [Euryarchaeota archaeon]RLF63989.1 MAG: HAD family hydrolase [Thermoplasmata archaeon]
MGLKAIFFDVDETLVYYDIENLEEKLREIIQDVIEYFNLKISFEDFQRMVRFEVPRTYVENFGVDPLEFWRKIDENILSFRKKLASLGLIKAFPDTEVLRNIKLPMAAISNASTEAAEFVLEVTGLKKYFKIVQGKDYRNINGCKPNPYLILKVSRALNVNPKDVMMVGDSELDVLAAKRANAIAVHVRRFDKDVNGADIVINNLYELLDVISCWK